MNRKIRAVCVGVGMTGSQLADKVIDRGIEIVGAVGRVTNAGCDLGSCIGRTPMGIKIETDLESVLNRTKPDIAIISTVSKIRDLAPAIRTCIKNRVNVITTSADSYFWRITDPIIGEELDEMAKEYGVTVYASGIQTVNWGALPVALSGNCHSISRISGTNCALVDEFGPAVMEEIGIGRPASMVEAEMDAADAYLDEFGIALYALAEMLRLTPNGIKINSKAIGAKEPTYCRALDRTLEVGDLVETDVTTEMNTKEGITLSCNFISKLAKEGDTSFNQWSIEGEPNIDIYNAEMHGEVTTTSGLINCIPDVINAEPGFLTINNMPIPYFKVHSLEQYVN